MEGGWHGGTKMNSEEVANTPLSPENHISNNVPELSETGTTDLY